MRKILYLLVTVACCSLIFGFSELKDESSSVKLSDLDPSFNIIQIPGLNLDPTKMACCKICKKGKACGDTCINKNYTCRKPPGCACNG